MVSRPHGQKTCSRVGGELSYREAATGVCAIGTPVARTSLDDYVTPSSWRSHNQGMDLSPRPQCQMSMSKQSQENSPRQMWSPVRTPSGSPHITMGARGLPCYRSATDSTPRSKELDKATPGELRPPTRPGSSRSCSQSSSVSKAPVGSSAPSGQLLSDWFAPRPPSRGTQLKPRSRPPSSRPDPLLPSSQLCTSIMSFPVAGASVANQRDRTGTRSQRVASHVRDSTAGSIALGEATSPRHWSGSSRAYLTGADPK